MACKSAMISGLSPFLSLSSSSGLSLDRTYNFVNPESLGPAVIAVGVVLATISTAFGAGRLYANRSKMHLADCKLLHSLTFVFRLCSKYKSFRHQWDTPVCFYSAASAAILLLYRQLFAIQNRTRIAINFGVLITFLVYISNIPLAAIYLAPRVVEIPILFRLNMSVKRRVQLAGIFSTALLGVGANVVSLVFKVKLLRLTDVGWLAAITNIASLVETNIAIIVGCMPALAQLASTASRGTDFFRSLWSRLLGTPRYSSKSKSREGTSKGEGQDGTPSLVTFGRNQTPRRNNYHELTNNSLLKSQRGTTVRDPAED
ncbi:hypothetical protein F5Y10DRAFT_283077 [Nemania abortiva]|nr:hypothetical protein F5Y10DRAFT_283077 [Nemania abortiva]